MKLNSENGHAKTPNNPYKRNIVPPISPIKLMISYLFTTTLFMI